MSTQQVQADPIEVIVGLVAGSSPAWTAQRSSRSRSPSRAAGLDAQPGQALLDNPTVLIDGRSPAVCGVWDLLNALHNAGATTVSPPRCAECGKPLRTLQRRGEDWYCGPCGTPAPAALHRLRHGGDRGHSGSARWPRCKQCPDEDLRKPARRAHGDRPRAGTAFYDGVCAAVSGIFSTPTSVRRLTWAIEDNRRWRESPIQGVLRLIDELVAVGATTISRPPCPGCDWVVPLHRRLNGRWHCRNCLGKPRAQPCAPSAGTVREAAARD
jgi:ribosomal protein L37AE/L43A